LGTVGGIYGMAVSAPELRPWTRETLAAKQQPRSERKQNERGNEHGSARIRQGLDPHDRPEHDAGERARDEEAGERASKAVLVTEAEQRAWGRGYVEQQVRRRDRRARDAQESQGSFRSSPGWVPDVLR